MRVHFSKNKCEIDSENDIDTVGNTSDQESSDEDLTRAPRIRAKSIEEGTEFDDFELPQPAKFMNEIYGEKVNILGAFHRFNLGSQQEPKKESQIGELPSFKLQSNESTANSLQKFISLNQQNDKRNCNISIQSNTRFQIPEFLANSSNDVSRVNKNSILGFLTSKVACKAQV